MFRYMDYALAVYEEKSFTKAAEKLFISQPSLSLTIKKLEDMLGMPVFERGGKMITLTSAGERYIAAAKEIGRIKTGFENELDDMVNLRRGKITVGSTYFISSYILPGILRAFKEKYPGIAVSLAVDSSVSLVHMLERGEVDFVIDNDMSEHNDCDQIPVLKEKILLGIPRDFEINKRLSDKRLTEREIKSGKYSAGKKICVSRLCGEKFILLKTGNKMREISDTFFAAAGFSPDAEFEFDQLMTSLSYAENGFGICFATDTVLRYGREYPKLCFYAPETEHSERTLYVIYKTNRYLTRASKAFIDEMRQSGVK